jgi:hypothetical protein
MNPPIDIKARLAKLRPLAISAAEAAEHERLLQEQEHDQKNKFKPGESHLQAFYRVNQERLRHLAFLARQKGGYDDKITNPRGSAKTMNK